MGGGVGPNDIAGAEPLHDAEHHRDLEEDPLPADRQAASNFNLGTHGERTVFPAATTPLITVTRQTGVTSFATPSAMFAAVEPALGRHRHGRLRLVQLAELRDAHRRDPRGRHADGRARRCSRSTQLEFTLLVPAGTPPAGGWPTVIFGHGFTDTKDGAPIAVAGTFARSGIATIAINVVGHGGGAARLYTVQTLAGAVTLADGGRGVDQDGNGTIDSTEGVNAIGAANELVGNRDGLRQTTIDLMQLVKVLQGGVEWTATAPRPEPSRIYYAGQSFGGIYGVQLLGARAEHPRRRAERPRRADHRDRAAQPVVPAARRPRAARARAVALQRGRRTSTASRTSTRTCRCGICRSWCDTVTGARDPEIHRRHRAGRSRRPTRLRTRRTSRSR